jgi:hypothetical protein
MDERAMTQTARGDSLVSTAVAAQLLFGLAIVLQPQFGHLGHFHNFAQAAFFTLLPGALVTMSLARRSVDRVLPSLPGMWIVFSVAALLPVVVSELVRGGCRDPLGIGHFLLETVLGIGVGLTFCAGISRVGKAWLALLAYLAWLALSLGVAVWPVLTGPAIFAFHPTVGYFPGAIYDRLFEIPDTFAWYRLLTLGMALLVVLALRRPRTAWPLILLLLALGATELESARMGIRPTHETLARELHHVRRHRGLVLHAAPERLRPAELERAWDELRFRYDQLAEALTLDDPRAEVYLFGTDARRWALMGARRVAVTKPWLATAYLSAEGWSGCTFKHELAHVLLAGHSGTAARVPMRGLLPDMGMTEGFAEALTDCATAFPVHWRASVMLREGELPSVAELADPLRFYALPGRRAYSAAASFFSFLWERRGREPALEVYRASDLSTLGQGMVALDRDWRAFLEREVTLAGDDAALLSEYLSRRSVFHQRCSLERARIQARMPSRVLAGRWDDVVSVLDELDQLEAGSAPALWRVHALVRLGRSADALTILDARLASEPPFPARFRLRLRRADLSLLEGRIAVALREYEALADGVHDEDMRRRVRFRQAALASPPLSVQLMGEVLLFPGREDATERVLRSVHPRDARLDYLLAGLLHRQGRYVEAAELLRGILRAPGALGRFPDVIRRARRLLGASAAYTGALDEAREIWGGLLSEAEGARDVRLVEDWLARIRHRGAR